MTGPDGPRGTAPDLRSSARPGSDTSDPGRFVASLPLFDRLPDDLLAGVLEHVTIVYEAAGTRLLTEGGPPASHLWIVRKGVVELRRQGEPILELEEGDWFGLPSLVDDAPPSADAVVTEDALLYRVTAGAIRPLVDHPAVAPHVRGGLAERLRATAGARLDRLGSVPVSVLVDRPAVVADAQTTAQQAAALMRDERVTSVIVEGDPRGIVTDRDLRNRLVAEGRSTSTPLSELASSPLVCVALDSTAADTLDVLISTSRHHAVVTSDGDPASELIGVVTTGDLLRHDADSGVHLVRMLDRARGADELVHSARRTPRLAANLQRAGAAPDAVTRAISGVTDAVTRSAIRLAVDELGDPGIPFTWLALGSQARREQGLLSDQDHALVHGPASEDQAEHLRRIATRVVDLLERAGLPRCPGDTMATRWSGDLDRWRRRFRSWLTTPDQQALYAAGIFLDLRAVTGEVDVSELSDVVRTAGADRVLLARLAAAAWTARPPIGLFHRLRADRSGHIDLKAGGLVPIVDLARVLAVEAGVGVTGTSARLEAAAGAGNLSDEGEAILTEAFRFLQSLRLRAQVAALEAGDAASNLIDPGRLGVLERRHLKEVLVEVAGLQERILTRLGANDVAR